MIYDVLIIGGGAGGLCAAVRLKQMLPLASVAIAEQLPRVGKKLITTGNGRCNITNKNINIERYHGEQKQFAEYALQKYGNDIAEEFFSEIGVLFTCEGDKVYPYSLQASSVVDALRFSAERLGIQIFTETKVTDFTHRSGCFAVKTENGDFNAKNIIVAAGLYSGGEKLGSDGAMLRLMKAKGYSSVKTTPAIVQLKTDNTVTRSLKGIKVNAEVSLLSGSKTIRRDSGEVLFCDYGLSGPPIMQLSRETARNDGEYCISLDIMPEYDFEKLISVLEKRVQSLESLPLEEFFTGMLNKRVGQALLKLAGLKLGEKSCVLNRKKILEIVSLIKALKFKVTGNTGFINSQVTAGGLSTKEFDSKTMMSKKHNGLYAIGEILDIDGDCGGFNLQWAWSSAFCAAEAIADRLGDKK